jgi:hypothetical protein
MFNTCQDHDEKIKNVGETKQTLAQYLERPWDRIDEYVAILQDFIRYTTQAKQETAKLEEAIQMLMDLRKLADDSVTLSGIMGYAGDLADLGPVFRHVSFESYEPILLKALCPFCRMTSWFGKVPWRAKVATVTCSSSRTT